jgi:hypothetical protein
MGNIMLNSLGSNLGVVIKIDPNSSALGSYNPSTKEIVFSSIDDMSIWGIREELFHAFQDQFYNGKLLEIMRTPLHTGGSNIEFESKAFHFISDYPITAGMEDTLPLNLFLDRYFSPIESSERIDINFSESEQQDWFNALEEFNNYHSSGDDLYGAPIDYDLLPEAFFNILEQYIQSMSNN